MYHTDIRDCEEYAAPTVEKDDGTVVTLPWVYRVCPVCEGRGSHVNPNIDRNGLTSEDFDEDPDFGEMYFGGGFDIPCNACAGKRVVPKVDEDQCDPALLQQYYDDLQEEAEFRSMQAAERRMGC